MDKRLDIRTGAYIDLTAIEHNIYEIKSRLPENTRVMAVIKADGYGHGAVAIARHLDQADMRYGHQEFVSEYGVAIVEEGEELRRAGIKKPILILGYTPAELIDDVVRYNLTQTIFDYESAEIISNEAIKQGKIADIHIKLDTGMTRIGFAPDSESAACIEAIAKLSGIRIRGLFSHLARADEKDKCYAQKQYETFCSFRNELERLGIDTGICHICNSAGAMELKNMSLDMVRLGIAMYGLYPSNEVDTQQIKLIPALEWRTHVSYVKHIDAGTQVSYGGTFTADKEMLIATIPVGYADGYPRQLSGKGRVLIHGRSARILGRICMDQFMVDVTDIPGVKRGDRVTLVGHDGEGFIPIEEPADMSGSFNYELACDISKRVPRIYK